MYTSRVLLLFIVVIFAAYMEHRIASAMPRSSYSVSHQYTAQHHVAGAHGKLSIASGKAISERITGESTGKSEVENSRLSKSGFGNYFFPFFPFQASKTTRVLFEQDTGDCSLQSKAGEQFVDCRVDSGGE